MIVTHKITMDLTRREKTPCIDVMQDDKYSRDLQIQLRANGMACRLPEDCSVLIRFEKADRCSGAYDTMPDGSKAWYISGDAITVQLAPQVCTAPGRVRLMITLLRGDAELSLFYVDLNVHRRLEGNIVSEEYVNIERFVPQPERAVVGQYLKVLAADENGRITALETAEAAGGEVGTGKTAYEYAVEGGYTGTEEEFAQKLAAEVPNTFYVGLTASGFGFTVDKTSAQIEEAYRNGRPICCLLPYDGTYLCVPLLARAYEGMAWMFAVTAMGESALVTVMNGQAQVMFTQFATTDDLPSVPTMLPNPYKLKFTGAISASYDGSMPITVTIPVELPKVTADNDGAFLRVVNGAWSAAAVTAAEEVSF